MVSYRFVCLFVSLLCSEFVLGENLPTNKRQKRYLSFPNKAAFVLTCSLLKGVASEVVVGPTIKLVTIHELDVIFPLPHDPSPFQLAQTALGQPPIYHTTHSRQRRDLYDQLEELLYMQGHDGRACLLKALCDTRTMPKTSEENLIQDLLNVIFSIPTNETTGILEEYHIDEKKCSKYKEKCPLSIFDLAFEWADQFTRVYDAS